MAKLANVVQLNRGVEVKNVYEVIHTYLERKGQNSSNTKGTYERAIRDFFRTMRNKELNELVADDLIFNKSQIEAYQVALKNQYRGATVNNSLTAIRECYKRLRDNKFDVELAWFDLESYDEHDSVSYDTLSHEEVIAIRELVSHTRKGAEKALLVRLAYATAFRKESLLTMKWNQIVNIDGQWYANVMGKGNKDSHKKISDNLYATLMEFKGDAENDAKIFQLTKKTIDKMMAFIRERMDFGTRRIVFHSFKKASLDEVNQLSNGDLKSIQAHGDHADVKTTLNSYIKKASLENLIEVDINNEIKLDAIEELSHEELLSAIRKLDRGTHIKLLREIGAM